MIGSILSPVPIGMTHMKRTKINYEFNRLSTDRFRSAEPVPALPIPLFRKP